MDESDGLRPVAKDGGELEYADGERGVAEDENPTDAEVAVTS